MADPVTMGLMAAGTLFSAYGAQSQGMDAMRSANSAAIQLDQRAGQTRASAQRQAEDQRRQARLAASALQARAGGGGSDATVVKLGSDIAGEGEYRALSSLYEGETSARGDELAADNQRESGRAARRAGNIKAISTIFGGGNSMRSRYGA